MQLLAQLDALGAWLVNPRLLAAGAAATALPILIHLLNRRRFRVVEWAAMEFLLVAEQENRRRLQLENVLLLVLRCLAVFLIGLLLARPFFSGEAMSGVVRGGRFEQIAVLDDSLSMQARVGTESAFEVARRRLADLATALSKEQADHALTVVLASQPERRVLDAEPLREDTIDGVLTRLKKLECGDGRVELAAVLEVLADRLAAEKPAVNRVVSVLTDLRRIDWGGAAGGGGSLDSTGRTAQQLKRLAAATQGCTLFDAANDDDWNLSIAQVRPDSPLIAGVPATLDVQVKNHGSQTAEDVHIVMSAEGVLPVEMTIAELPAQEAASVRFSLLLAESPEQLEGRQPTPRKVTLELRARNRAPDPLAADDMAYFAARVSAGIRVLLIDGDPSEQYGEGESFYLQRALAPEGPVASGILTSIVEAAAWDSAELDEYQVVFLLNADRLGDSSAAVVARLEAWVRRGGGVVIMPGDRVDEATFNRLFVKESGGLSPRGLVAVRGEASRGNWQTIVIEDRQHAVFGQFAGEGNLLLGDVKVFRWWQTLGEGELADGIVSARLDNAGKSPLAIEKTLGNGRTVLFTVPADADWHDWPSHPSYLLVMQDLVRLLAAVSQRDGQLRIGQPIIEAFPITEYEVDAELIGPGDARSHVKATPPKESPAPGEATIWQIEAPVAVRRGFYSLVLRGRDGSKETRLFAANTSPEESDLRRADRRELMAALQAFNIRILAASEPQSLHAAGRRTEVGWYLLWIVAAVLASEQVLGWWFGRQRT